MFISYEGIDGSGKSTQIALLKERFERIGIPVEVYREPGGEELGEQIRGWLLDPSNEIVPFAELLLFSAARAQLVALKIKPALEKGRVVICDRFFDSTTVYQGVGRDIGEFDWMVDFHLRVTDGLVPDRTYLLAIELREAIARVQQRDEAGQDRMEQQGGRFFQRVSEAYDKLARHFPERIVRLDATRPAENISEDIWADIEERWLLSHGTPIPG